MAKVEALFCPACGGRVDLEEGAPRGQCLSCKASLAVPSLMGFYHFFAEPKIGRNAALTIAATATDLPVENISAHLLFVPFWSIAAETFGFVAGQRPIKQALVDSSSDGPTSLSEAQSMYARPENAGGEVIKKSLWKEQVFHAPGVRWEDVTGLDVLKHGSRRLQPLEHQDLSDKGIRIEPHDLPAELASQEAAAYFQGHLLFPYGEYPILHAAIATLRTNRRLIYYPVWRLLGFTAPGRFKCVVDAVSGDRIHVRQYSREKPPHPTKYLIAALVLSLALSLMYVPAGGHGLRIAIGAVSLAGGIAAGIFIKKYAVDNLAERLCRFIWRL
ncbi:MAG: hypothetical protein QME74_09890 [Candidatus Edwardsbacteria bacterium]|nr:hypothetical protein [Candidatus Edwardsbacteria bacterium]